MADVLRMASFVAAHWVGALGAALAFFLGVASAPFVVRGNVRLLMALPVWLIRQLGRLLLARPPVWQVFLLIFVFNGTAMFVYMLMGLIPFLPAAVVFLTGMNVAVAAMKGDEVMTGLRQELLPAGEARPAPADRGAVPSRGSAVAALCASLVFMLELPCFWFTMAMAAAMPYWLGSLWADAHLVDLRLRVAAYAMVVLPLLAVSALAEAYAVTRPFVSAGPPES